MNTLGAAQPAGEMLCAAATFATGMHAAQCVLSTVSRDDAEAQLQISFAQLGTKIAYVLVSSWRTLSGEQVFHMLGCVHCCCV
jgi:hypothetical protein